MMKRWVVIGLLGVLIGVPSWAQTLDACQQLACDHYPEIRQYDLIRQSEQYDLVECSTQLVATGFVFGSGDLAKQGPRVSFGIFWYA